MDHKHHFFQSDNQLHMQFIHYVYHHKITVKFEELNLHTVSLVTVWYRVNLKNIDKFDVLSTSFLVNTAMHKIVQGNIHIGSKK